MYTRVIGDGLAIGVTTFWTARNLASRFGVSNSPESWN